ncbi:helix-turn-helix domain-containing protein [Novosphingobium sp. CF614]|uniref:helix-turn-helix domain-containing protein n=1 Tax=Novosphingobium sp. CF614 TaxID=1884364 RepID=UPI002100C533|nr:helix-turn-helix domain-containing protein [Novosphingobium sp. CF614]
MTETSAEFAHIETIAARSALHDWEITPHRHARSVQVLLVSSGQVEFRCDELARRLDAPCSIVVPIGSVHGFRFTPETSGHVLTLSAGFAARGGDPADPMLRMLAHGSSGSIPPGIEGRVAWLCAEMLAVQSDWRAPPPLFLALAEALVRSLQAEPREGEAPPLDSRQLSGFRHLVELHMREHRPVSWYAQRIGTTSKTLTRICRRRLDCTPAQVIHARLVLEARRLLHFTNASIVQVADELGFSDPSYFSRFYLRMTGHRPRQDKDNRAGTRK